jgi:hypothetical protein
MSDDKHYGPWEGMPTKPDVDALIREWPDLDKGDKIPYGDVEACTGIEHGPGRWSTVTNAWRSRMLNDKELVIKCDRANRAFFVATAGDISSATYGVLRGIGRKARRQRKELAIAKPQNDAEREDILHKARLMSAVEREAKKARMNVFPSTQSEDVPRIAQKRSD